MQLKTLAAENAALRLTIAEREQKDQHDLQDLRNFCIASQEQSSNKDSSIHAELQQHQQELAGRMSTYEASVMEFTATTQKISSRLDTVSLHQCIAAMCISSPAKPTKPIVDGEPGLNPPHAKKIQKPPPPPPPPLFPLPPLPELLLASVSALALEPGLLADTCCRDP